MFACKVAIKLSQQLTFLLVNLVSDFLAQCVPEVLLQLSKIPKFFSTPKLMYPFHNYPRRSFAVPIFDGAITCVTKSTKWSSLVRFCESTFCVNSLFPQHTLYVSCCMHRASSYNTYINKQDAQNSCDQTLFSIRCSTCFGLYQSIIRSNFISCISHLVYAGTIRQAVVWLQPRIGIKSNHRNFVASCWFIYILYSLCLAHQIFLHVMDRIIFGYKKLSFPYSKYPPHRHALRHPYIFVLLLTL